jgi:hypothetical protein
VVGGFVQHQHVGLLQHQLAEKGLQGFLCGVPDGSSLVRGEILRLAPLAPASRSGPLEQNSPASLLR